MNEKCDRCGKPSVYHSMLTVNGVSQSTNLCRECALKEGVFSAEPTTIFEDFFAPFSDFLPFEQVADLSCPVCKTTLRQFKNTLRLGCPNCYDTFDKEISNLINRIAPYEAHKQEKLNELIKNKATKTKQTKAEKIADLRAEMAKAVSEERYEDAGKLKKKIQKLESENE